MKIKKTNASRILDNMKIAYRLLEYEVDENNLDAVHVANTVGMPSSQVFKTLCVNGDKTGVVFACIPGDHELDLKALAKISGNKRAELVALKEVLPLTVIYVAVFLRWVRKRPILCFWTLRQVNGMKFP